MPGLRCPKLPKTRTSCIEKALPLRVGIERFAASVPQNTNVMDHSSVLDELPLNTCRPSMHNGGSSWGSFWGCPKGLPSSTPHRYVQITWRPGCYSGARGTPKNDSQNETPLCMDGRHCSRATCEQVTLMERDNRQAAERAVVEPDARNSLRNLQR